MDSSVFIDREIKKRKHQPEIINQQHKFSGRPHGILKFSRCGPIMVLSVF